MGLETVEFVMAVEEEFDLTISDREAEKLPTPRHLGDLLEIKLKESGRAMPREEIDRKLKEITIEQIGISEGEYRLDAEYIRDFRMN